MIKITQIEIWCDYHGYDPVDEMTVDELTNVEHAFDNAVSNYLKKEYPEAPVSIYDANIRDGDKIQVTYDESVLLTSEWKAAEQLSKALWQKIFEIGSKAVVKVEAANH